MRRFLLDTGPAQAYISRVGKVYATARERIRAGNRVGVGIPVLGELMGGVELSTTRDRNIRRLEQELHDFLFWPYDEAAAREYGRIYAYLRRIGRPMQQIDMQTAAIARNLVNCTLVTSDSDFAAIPGLSIENWS